MGSLSIILDPPTAVGLGDKLTVTVFSVLLVQLLSSASSVQLGFFFFFTVSYLPLPMEKEMATHSSILAWKIPRTEKPGRLQSMGSQRVGHDRATSLSFFLSFFLSTFPFPCLPTSALPLW